MAKSAVKFNDSASTCDRLLNDIRGRRYAPVYLLMGEEGYFIDAVSELVAATVLDEAERAFGQLVVYGRDTEAGQVVNYCRQVPMMGERQVVIVKEAQQLRNLDKLALYTANPLDSTLLVICHKEKSVDKRSQLYKSVSARGEVLESVRPRDYEIGPWLSNYIATQGRHIDEKALGMLVNHLGTDLQKVTNEVKKLLLSLPPDRKRITDADIEANIGISKDFNNYELCKAVVEQQADRAMMIAERMGHNPKEYPLLLTVLVLFNQFRQLFIYNYLCWLARRKGQPMPPDMELMKLTRTNNPYALKELRRIAPAWPNRRVFRILGLLREYDAKSKGCNTGGAPDGELLRELLLKIFLP